MSRGFRHTFATRIPSWLSAGAGGAVLYVQNALSDAMRAVLRSGVQARFPTYASESALALIGRERGIPRGRSEEKDHYAARLRRWRYPRGHRTRGSAYALLEQIWEYWGAIRCWTIDVNQTRHLRGFDGAESVSYAYPWNWDGDVVNWARFWFVLEPNPDRPEFQPVIGVAGEYGGTLDHEPDSEFCAGLKGMTSEDWNAMRRLFKGPHQWKPAGTMHQFAMVYYGDYTSTTLAGPAGDWDDIHARINAELSQPIRFVRLTRP